MSDKDFVERHKLVTRSMAIAVTSVFVYVFVWATPQDKLIEYASWAVVFMFSALLFGDKMLVQIKDIVKAWRGNG